LQTNLPERRKNPRIEKGLPLKISCDQFDIVTETKNISLAGVYCSVDRELALMTKFNILLLLPFHKAGKALTKKVSCSGVIVRNEAPQDRNGKHHTAIFFSEINKKDRKILSDFLNLLSPK
jgi:hypothetical protein